MNIRFALRSPLVVAACLMLPLAASAQTMAKAEHDAAKTRVTSDYKAAKATCASLAGNARDICAETAKGKEKVALAELEYHYTGKPEDGTKVLVARAESTYAVAREKCDDMAGNVKDVCVTEAKAEQSKALASAKLGKDVGTARKAAAEDMNEADLKVAVEKCDALAGEAKDACIAAAKAKFGKT